MLETPFFAIDSNTILTIGGLISLVAYLVSQYRNGGKKATDEYNKGREELIKRLNEQLEAQRQINTSVSEQLKTALSQLQALTLELGEMKGQLKTYEAILQNRNPELEKTLANINSMAVILPQFMVEVRRALNIRKGKYTEATLKENASETRNN